MNKRQINRRRGYVSINLFSWEEGDGFSALKRMIQEADARIESEGLEGIDLSIETTYDYYGDVSGKILTLTARREETDEEVMLKLQSEKTADQIEIERLTKQLEHLQRKQK